MLPRRSACRAASAASGRNPASRGCCLCASGRTATPDATSRPCAGSANSCGTPSRADAAEPPARPFQEAESAPPLQADALRSPNGGSPSSDRSGNADGQLRKPPPGFPNSRARPPAPDNNASSREYAFASSSQLLNAPQPAVCPPSFRYGARRASVGGSPSGRGAFARRRRALQHARQLSQREGQLRAQLQQSARGAGSNRAHTARRPCGSAPHAARPVHTARPDGAGEIVQSPLLR